MSSLSKIFSLTGKTKSVNNTENAIHKDEERAGNYVGSFDFIRNFRKNKKINLVRKNQKIL